LKKLRIDQKRKRNIETGNEKQEGEEDDGRGGRSGRGSCAGIRESQ
jgi:hypothetical protein